MLPLRDTYSTTYLSYGYGSPPKYATPSSQDTSNDGVLDWPDLTVSFGKALGVNEHFEVIVYFTGIKDTTGLANIRTVNTAAVHDAYADPDGPGGQPPIPLPPDTASDGVQIVIPTGVGVSDFGGVRQGGQVVLTWRDGRGGEPGRLQHLAEGWRRRAKILNGELLYAQNAGANLGATYSFVDPTAPAGLLTYVLEAVRLDGSVAAVGQIEVKR